MNNNRQEIKLQNRTGIYHKYNYMHKIPYFAYQARPIHELMSHAF